jgi:hypothetical protein
MTPRFLRDEASRFRGMANDTDREATKLRLLAMAADYEARAEAAGDSTAPHADEATISVGQPDLAEPAGDAVEPRFDEPPEVKPARKAASGLKETIVIQRRPVGRPRQL